MINSSQNKEFCFVTFLFQYFIILSDVSTAQLPGPYCNPDGFVQLGETKFYINPELLSWSDALQKCKKVDMKLATIRSASENTEAGWRLQRAFRELNISRERNVWIGGKGTDHREIYEWADGSQMTYLGFGTEPEDETRGQNICLYVTYPFMESNYLQWNHADCMENKPFLCETSKEDCFLSDSIVPHTSLMQITGTEYYLSLQKLNWQDALEFCKQYDLLLVSIHAPYINDEIGNILGKDHQLPMEFSFWTSGSLHFSDLVKARIIWMSRGTMSKGQWAPWAKDEPIDQSYSSSDRRCTRITEECVEAILYPGGKVRWAASDCARPLPFLCTSPPLELIPKYTLNDQSETNMGPTTKSGFYFSYSGTEYFLGKYLHHWRDALKSCLSRNMDLYSPDNPKEHFAIANFLWKRKSNKRRCKYWTSGINLTSTHEHVWFSTLQRVPQNRNYFDRKVSANINTQTCVYLELCKVEPQEERTFKLRIQSCRDASNYKDRKSENKLSYICEEKKFPKLIRKPHH